MEKNTNINVFEEFKENYLRPSKYAKAQVNVLDEVSQSYSHQGKLELDQTKYTIELRDHEFENSEVAELFSRVCAFCEEEKRIIMDCPFVPFHIRANIARHVELQNVTIALMDQSQKQELGILIIQNKLRGKELGG